MKFNKNSKLMKISAGAEGYYSGATAYGEIYLPYEIYLKNKEKLEDELEVYVGELDGKHSEVECDIDFEEYTFKDLLRIRNSSYEVDRDIDESVYYRICDVLNLSDEQSEQLNKFNIKICELDRFPEYEDVEIELKSDTEIQNVIVPKGTKIEFTRKSVVKIPENWAFEFELNIH